MIAGMKHPSLQTLEEYTQELIGSAAASGIARFFHLPAVLIVGPKKHLLTTDRDVELVYSRIKEKYRTEEIVRLAWDDSETSLFQIYPDLVVLKAIMCRSRSDGSVVRTWACSYLVREIGGAWKFDLVTAIPN